MQLLIASYLFIIGACMGSFVGAMAWRYKKGKGIVRERSECEACHHTLSWYDLIPVLSWLMLRGKCRYCKKPIGWTPFVLEAMLGLAFIVSYLFWPYGLDTVLQWTYLIIWLIALVMLAFLFVYDIRHFLLPDMVVWPLVATGALLFAMRAIEMQWGAGEALWELLLSMIPITGIYWMLYIISRGAWIGFGDVKFGIFVGLALGWQGALLVLLLSNVLGCLWIIPGLITKRIKPSSRIPFGPFLIAATYLAFIWGEYVVSYYLSMFLV